LAIKFQAQNNSNSPYSRFGIGELQTIQTPRHVAMGGLSLGLIGSQNLSVKNPASYLNLDTLSVTFEVTLQATYSGLSEKQSISDTEIKTVSAITNSASLGQISFAFPITSWIKSCFGLTPTSNVSYNVIQELASESNVGKQFLRHRGHGGLSQAFLGFAVGTSRIAVGANANYQFGAFVYNREQIFEDTVLVFPMPTYHEYSLDATGLFWDLGVQYRQPLTKQYQIGFGFTYSPKYSLKASKNQQIHTNYDLVFESESEKGTLEMPDKYAIGLSFEKLNRWVVGAEYSVVNFKKYRENLGGQSTVEEKLSNAYMLRLGMELKGKRMDNNFMNRLSYRLGYNQGTNYIVYDRKEIKQYGVSFGFGMPISRTQSRLDFAVEIGRKGSVDAGQIQENYGRIVIGISAFDHWFMRGKFD
jgi:hypothetical protein